MSNDKKKVRRVESAKKSPNIQQTLNNQSANHPLLEHSNGLQSTQLVKKSMRHFDMHTTGFSINNTRTLL